MPVALDETEQQYSFVAFMLNRFKGCECWSGQNELKVYKINKVGSISKKVKKEINTELKFLKYIPCINSKW